MRKFLCIFASVMIALSVVPVLAELEIDGALQFDAAPTSGSANLVKSGALFAALIGAEGTFTRKNGLWTVKKSKVRQVGTRVFMSLWLDRNEPLGSSQIEIGSITGVSLPTGATLFACATAAGVALTAVHPAAGFVTAAGGAAKVYVQPAEPTDTMVFVNAFYYTEN